MMGSCSDFGLPLMLEMISRRQDLATLRKAFSVSGSMALYLSATTVPPDFIAALITLAR